MRNIQTFSHGNLRNELTPHDVCRVRDTPATAAPFVLSCGSCIGLGHRASVTSTGYLADVHDAKGKCANRSNWLAVQTFFHTTPMRGRVKGQEPKMRGLHLSHPCLSHLNQTATPLYVRPPLPSITRQRRNEPRPTRGVIIPNLLYLISDPDPKL